MTDYFISYNSADKKWAEWIAWQLEEAGNIVVFQGWDFRPGENFVLKMHEAAQETRNTIIVLTQAYLTSEFAQSEWAAAFVQDPKGNQRRLIPVRVGECQPKGLLTANIYIDLVGLEESEAKNALLKGINKERAKPESKPSFPDAGQRLVPKAPRFPGALPTIWNVPHLRNFNFTGRENLLKTLRESFTLKQSSLLNVAVHGLGGVGKTQVALEYTYRYSNEYEIVWWIRAEDTTTLAADYAGLGSKLMLPEKDAKDQSVIIAAVRHWLEQNQGWLLVFDNAEDVDNLLPYLPKGQSGHVLITSRNPNWEDVAKPFKAEEFSSQEAVDFLCNRTGQNDRVTAQVLAEALGHLPLALAQAGAYIKNAGKSLADYLEMYRTYEQKILERGKPAADYKNTVATTWEISFEQVEERMPAAVNLLHLCAFLAPDNIPRNLLSEGAKKLSYPQIVSLTDPLIFDDAVIALRSYSLIDATIDSLSIHRLVQSVTRDRLSIDVCKEWAQIALQIVNEFFPSDSYYATTWPQCEIWLPHAQETVQYAEKNGILTLEYLDLLGKIAAHMRGRAMFPEAEILGRKSLEIYTILFGEEDSRTAIIQNNLARILHSQEKFDEAETLYRKALEVGQKHRGKDHLDDMPVLTNLARLYQDQSKYDAAEPILRKVLRIREKHLGKEHSDYVWSLNNLGELLFKMGNYAEAEQLLRKALSLFETKFSDEVGIIAKNRGDLGELLLARGKYSEAEPLLRRALEYGEGFLGKDHPSTQNSRKLYDNCIELMKTS